MASPNRFVLPGEGLIAEFRRRPAALAIIAATGGLLCGALAVGALSAPGGKPAEPVVATTPAAASEAAPARVAEAKKPNDAKPAGKTAQDKTAQDKTAEDKNEAKTAAADCRDQTWPYLSRSCLTEAKPQTRGVRVVSTDRLSEPTIGSIEASSTPKQAVEPPAAPLVTPVADVTPAAAPTSNSSPSNPPQVLAAIKALDRAPAPVTSAPTPEPAVAASTPAPEVAPVEKTAKQPVAKPKHTRVAKSRMPKPRDANVETVAAGNDEDDDGRHIVQQRDPYGRHIVRRWIERDYHARDDDGVPGTRRVIVMQRPYQDGAAGYAADSDDDDD